MDLPAWVHNFPPTERTQSDIAMVIIVSVVMMLLASITTAARVFVRRRLLNVWKADDWWIVGAMLCSLIYSGMVIEETRWGLGLDITRRPVANRDHYSRVNFGARPFYMLAVTGFKVSLLLSYLRLIGTRNHYRTVIWFTIGLCMVTHLAGTLVLVFQCKPVAKSWRPELKGSCLPNGITFTVLSANSIIFDIVIIVLPVPLLWPTFISPKKKAVLSLLFGLFSFTTVCSFLRMDQIRVLMRTGNSTGLVLWGVVEMNVGILTTSIPTLSPLMKLLFGNTRWARYLVFTSASRQGYPSSNSKSRGAHPGGFMAKLDCSGAGNADDSRSFIQLESKSRDPPARPGRDRDSEHDPESGKRGISTYISSPGDSAVIDLNGIHIKREVVVETASRGDADSIGTGTCSAGAWPWREEDSGPEASPRSTMRQV